MNPTSPYQAAVPPPQKSKTLPILLGVGGCLTILCIGLLVVGGIILFISRSPEQVTRALPGNPTQLVVPTNPTSPTSLPRPTQKPAATQAQIRPTQVSVPAPTQAALVWPADIGQQLTDNTFSDDFSSSRFDWADREDDIRFWGIQDGHYFMHLKIPDHTIWAYLPVDIPLTTLEFDAAVLPGAEQGAYGVFCYYEDEENYHFVSIDPYDQDYSVGYVKDNEYISLLADMWMPSQFIDPNPYAINHVAVTCDSDLITVFVNGKFEAQTEIDNRSGGVSAIYGETWKDTPAPGLQVLFDNLYGFKPVQ